MNIVQIGEVYLDRVTQQRTIYPNKTKKFLLPCLKEYGANFTNKLNNVFKVASGIGDIVVDNCGLKFESHLFILLDCNIAPKYFKDFIKWIRDQPMYTDDYVFGNIQDTTQHMVVIKLPEKYHESLISFKKGKYSEMFNAQDIEMLFQANTAVKKILIKDKEYAVVFTRRINKHFDTSIDPATYEGELNLPPIEAKEVFNHHLKQ